MTFEKFILTHTRKKKFALLYILLQTVSPYAILTLTDATLLAEYTWIGFAIYLCLSGLFLHPNRPLNTQNLSPILISPFHSRNDLSTDASGESSDAFIGVVAEPKGTGAGAAASSVFYTQIVHSRRKGDPIKREPVTRGSTGNNGV
jgi:hypothetical protein